MKVLHISIPKNGGTFIANNLARNFAPDAQYIVDEDVITLNDFLQNADRITSRYDFVAGHVPFRLLGEHAKKFDLIISSLREPWSRCWSTFRYVAATQVAWTNYLPASEDDIPEKFESFIDKYFVANRFTRNHQCGFLGEGNLPHLAMSNIDRYGIKVIPFDHLENDLRILMRNHGMVFAEGAPKNSAAEGPLAKPGHWPAIDRKIDDWFDGDFQLHKALLTRLRRGATS